MQVKTATDLDLAARCQRLSDPFTLARCGRSEAHPAHDPLGGQFGARDLHPYDNVPALEEDGEVVYEPDDGLGWD